MRHQVAVSDAHVKLAMTFAIDGWRASLLPKREREIGVTLRHAGAPFALAWIADRSWTPSMSGRAGWK